MRGDPIFYHPSETPTVEHIATKRVEGVVVNCGGVAFAFRDFGAFDQWLAALSLSADIARRENGQLQMAACRKVLANDGERGLVAAGSELVHPGARS